MSEKRHIPVRDTFRHLRRLPLAVSLEQVRAWIDRQPLGEASGVARRSWLQRLLRAWSKN